ncbi:MAG: ABC transporter substrate-binding protein [Xanthobacteraceae bacterium]|nr:ABC transporter substrate-binding protein [Xanthobacteraceae bacterium]
MAIRSILAGVAALACLSGGALAQETVVAGALRFVSNGALFVAIEKGFFKEEGLEVELRFFQAAQPIAVAVVSGDVDVGMTAFTGGFYNLAGKGGLKVIAAQAREKKGYEGNAVLVSKAAFAKGFRKIEDFPGHSLGITQVGSSFHYQIGQLARIKGFDLKRVELKPLQSLPAMAAALKTNQVDALIIAPHIAKGLAAAGDAHLIGWYSDFDEYQFGALFTSPKMIEARRATLEKFVRAYQKGAGEFASAMLRLDGAGKRVFDPAAADPIAGMIAKYVYPSDPPAEGTRKVKGATFYVDAQARLDVGDIHGQVAWYKSQGMVDAAVDPKAFIDLGFVKGHTNVPR